MQPNNKLCNIVVKYGTSQSYNISEIYNFRLYQARGCPLAVHYRVDLQLVHGFGFGCYDNITPKEKCQRVLVLALCLVTIFSCMTSQLTSRSPVTGNW